MKSKQILAALVVFSLPRLVAAQTKISGTLKCNKPDPQHVIEIGDRPGHAFMIGKSTCTWSKPMEIAGVQNKEGVATSFDEIRGGRSRSHGYYDDTMANGDKADYRFQGTSEVKGGAIQSAENRWRAVGATGKLKGLKSHGTCKGTATGDGGVVWECEGEYELPGK